MTWWASTTHLLLTVSNIPHLSFLFLSTRKVNKRKLTFAIAGKTSNRYTLIIRCFSTEFDCVNLRLFLHTRDGVDPLPPPTRTYNTRNYKYIDLSKYLSFPFFTVRLNHAGIQKQDIALATIFRFEYSIQISTDRSRENSTKNGDGNSLVYLLLLIRIIGFSLLVVLGECHLTETQDHRQSLQTRTSGYDVIRSARDTHLVKIDCPSSWQSRKTSDWYSWNSISRVCVD